MKNLLYSALLICAFSFASCGGGGCDANDITNAAQKISTASTAYINDPTTENCETYLAALQDYVDELSDCDLINQSDIDTYNESLKDLTC